MSLKVGYVKNKIHAVEVPERHGRYWTTTLCGVSAMIGSQSFKEENFPGIGCKKCLKIAAKKAPK